MTMTKEERLQNIIDNLYENDIIEMWNERCAEYGYSEDYIYYMDELDDQFGKMLPSEFVNTFASDFSTRDDYFRDGIYGVESFNDIYDVVDDDELIAYLIDEDEDFNHDDIREVLDDDEDEEDEEEEDEEDEEEE